MKPTISVVIPAFNEEKTIEEVILSASKALVSTRLPYEIIVVDDGSLDRTRELAMRHDVVVLSNGENQGKGYALQKGFGHARGDVIVTIDADGSHYAEDIVRLLESISDGADVVLGSRFGTGDGKRTTCKLHAFGNDMINFLIRAVTGKQVTDSQTGFRAFRSRVIREIRLTSKGYQIETELTVKTLRNGNVVKEVPITPKRRENGSSHINPLQDGIKIFRTILSAGFN